LANKQTSNKQRFLLPRLDVVNFVCPVGHHPCLYLRSIANAGDTSSLSVFCRAAAWWSVTKAIAQAIAQAFSRQLRVVGVKLN
jgi:hypothetical protein